MEFTLVIDIKPEQQQKLKEALENFCSDNFIPQPVLKQCNVMRSLPLTEGAIKTNVKKAVTGLMAAPPPPPKPRKDTSGGNGA